MGIQSNIKELNDTMTRVKSHCMCVNLTETPNHFLIIYPDGHKPDGLRIEKGGSKIKALKTAFEYMEKHWKESWV